MKMLNRIIALTLVVLLTAGGAFAREAEPAPQVLSEAQLAAIHGGFCPFEKCEDAPGTGVCQAIAANTQALCAVMRCTFFQFTIGRSMLEGCDGKAGVVTCSVNQNYRQCVWALQMSTCSPGATPVCGQEIRPDCFIEVEERCCLCYILPPEQSCEWTDCTN
jgi:hypothetical protein